MEQTKYDIIVIGAGSGGLSVGLFMSKAGFKVLMIAKTDKDIGGDCLNDGCVPSKALIHLSRIVQNARLAGELGLQVSGEIDIKKITKYIYDQQEVIRAHENATWLKEQGVDVALGMAAFTDKNEVTVNGKKYKGNKIVIATGSKPRKLNVPGIEQVNYLDNENVFHLEQLPKNLLVIGGGPIGIEIAQSLSRLGSNVTIVHQGDMILEHDDNTVAEILLSRLKEEGIKFLMDSSVESFTSPTLCTVITKDEAKTTVSFDTVFVAVGRELALAPLNLSKAGIAVADNKIVTDKYLRTTNKHVFVCGDIAGSLQFSHAAEFHARILLNNFFSPFKKKLNNDYMSWVTFTDPELATFGLNEAQLKERQVKYRKLEQDFNSDDRAITDNYRYAKSILYIGTGLLNKNKVLGGTMIAPNAGELIQELVLANTGKISINTIFNKIYPYPVASRINQQTIVNLKEESLTGTIKKLLQYAYKIFS